MKTIATAIAAMAIIVSASVGHAREVRFCARWEAEYQDWDMGTRLSHARYNYSIPGSYISVLVNGTRLNGLQYLLTDASGCITPIDLSTGDKVTILFHAALFDIAGARSIVLLNTTATSWDQQNQPGLFVFENWGIKYKYTGPTDGAPTTATIVIPQGETRNMLPAASALLSHAATLDWVSGEKIRIATTRNTNLCDPGRGSWHVGPENGYYRVCINAPTATSAATHTDNKVVILHEIGHAISQMNNGPHDGEYEADAAGVAQHSNVACRYGTKPEKTHAFHSREWSGTAAKEAFSHFIAAAAVNSRTPSGEFRYYKTSYAYDPVTGITGTPKNQHFDLLVTQPDSNYTRYTNNVCAPPTGFRHLGSERDWLDFFWALWTEPDLDLRFSVNQLNLIWDGVNDNAIWTYCVPRTATGANVYAGPSSSPFPVTIKGEAGWTCLPFKWNFVETVACPGEDLCPAATPSAKYNRGKSWTDLLTEARDQYEGVNFAKYDYFYNTGLKAGVRYQ